MLQDSRFLPNIKNLITMETNSKSRFKLFTVADGTEVMIERGQDENGWPSISTYIYLDTEDAFIKVTPRHVYGEGKEDVRDHDWENETNQEMAQAQYDGCKKMIDEMMESSEEEEEDEE